MLKGSVKQKLFLMISVLILVSVSAATILSDRSYRNDLIAQSTQSTRQLLEQLSINLDTYIDELFRLCLSPYYNKRVMEQLESTPATAAERLNKQRIIEDYILEREQLTNLFVLIDCRHEPQKIDLEFMEWLGENEIPFSLIFTKIDKISKGRLQENLKVYQTKLLESWEELPPILLSSSEKKEGRDKILNYIDEINKSL